MTKAETESMLRYIMSLYPNARLSTEKFNGMIESWSEVFKTESKQSMYDAIKVAAGNSPSWMPTAMEIKDALRFNASKISNKSKEQVFRDEHCGKSEEEWKALVDWENSPDGAAKILKYKQRLFAFLGD